MPNLKDLILGVLLVSIGSFVLAEALTQMDVGTAFRMGPGFFPAMLGGLLAAFGAIIIMRGFRREHSPMGSVSWRGILLISAAPVIFGLGVRGLGLAPTVAVTTLVSVLASPEPKLRTILGVTLVLTTLSVLIFSYGLGLPIGIVGPWLGG